MGGDTNQNPRNAFVLLPWLIGRFGMEKYFDGRRLITYNVSSITVMRE
jgi:hypothetical protein